MIEPSAVEKTASNLMVKGAANAVAVFGATLTPLAAFVPFLVDTLASGRQSQRVEGMLRELNELLKAHSEKLKDITDDQYKLVNEAIAAAFYTIDRDKLEVLKRAAANAISPDYSRS